jgi:hypothetical protein
MDADEEGCPRHPDPVPKPPMDKHILGFWQWLRSPTAIKAHLVFLSAIGLLTYSVLTGNQGPAGDYPLALVFCGIAYPVILLLVWVRWRINGGSEF